MALRVLVACRDRSDLERLEPALTDQGYEVFCADAQNARRLARGAVPDVILWGLGEGDEPKPSAIARELPGACVIELYRAGAAPNGPLDALALPCSDAELRSAMRRAGAWCRTQRELRLLRREQEVGAGDRPIVAASTAMIELLEALERAAGFRACVLLRGERGTGKEGLARAVHALSDRRARAFVAVSCLRSDPEQLTAELFGGSAGDGPVRGGSLVDAEGSTLFLDDVDALPASCQERLLGVLQSEEIDSPVDKPRRVDVRVIAATACDLGAKASVGEFAGALRERLASLELAVPSLRERPEDIPLLIDHFTARASRSLARPRPTLADEALERLVAYRWPGNLRELENVTFRAVLLARAGRIGIRELPERLETGEEASDPEFGLRRARRRLEIDVIRRALRQTGGNRTHAAKLLEISHRALLYKLKDYGIKD